MFVPFNLLILQTHVKDFENIFYGFGIEYFYSSEADDLCSNDC